MLYIANAVIIANWYGPIKIEVDGIIQASAMKQIIKSVTDQCRLYPNPCIVIKKFKHSKNHIPKDAIKIITDGIEVFIPLEGLIDLEEERKRLQEEKKRLEGEVARCEKMLSNPGFINKAPQSKIDEEKAKLEKYAEMLKKVKETLKS